MPIEMEFLTRFKEDKRSGTAAVMPVPKPTQVVAGGGALPPPVFSPRPRKLVAALTRPALGACLLFAQACVPVAAARSLGGLSPTRFPYALATRGCTQEDAPALEIILTEKRFNGRGEPAPPYLRLELAWDTPGKLANKRFNLIPLTRTRAEFGAAIVRAEYHQARTGAVFLQGTLQLGRVAPGAGVDGSYRATLPDGRVLEGKFSAVWRESSSVCG